ncbi:uncharacterized protein T551_00389 [Pneumocystis jirovecii RU7]|uniref:SEC7 domain-containing protein n=1 Tax=Pneumocystis jirovecii (strain RU7) TaxID=1408657 RepID=A0A0W4ZV96_PNEJ7|nr:uncharacterized protein T551_00389 [Pneumocystis jirovecii RU7]KTW32298.1 hypothetical protein T551_00389 [Pneumocystis jirovecii RU7]
MSALYDSFKESISGNHAAFLIINELSMIVSVIRKNIRDVTSGSSIILGVVFGSAYDENMDVNGPQNGKKGDSKSVENILLHKFSQLKSKLVHCTDISSLDTLVILNPFIYIIESPLIAAPIKSLAFNSLIKFFSYRIINPDSLQFSLAIKQLLSAVTCCKFETHDSLQDETVLLRIFKLIEEITIGIGEKVICDSSICEIIQICLNICCRLRLSKILRKSVEITMLSIVQSVFRRLKEISPENEELSNETTNGQTFFLKNEEFYSNNKSTDTLLLKKNDDHKNFSDNEDTKDSEDNKQIDQEIFPYGILSIKEIFYTLILLLDPHNKHNTDIMRIIALRMINAAIEVSGLVIGYHFNLRHLVTDKLCRYLFQLVQFDNFSIIFHSLKVISLLLHVMKPFLKFQQEVFLRYAISYVYIHNDALKYSSIDSIFYEGILDLPKFRYFISGKDISTSTKEKSNSGTGEGSKEINVKEVIMECIFGLVQTPSFMVDLFVNYDCEINMCNLCEDIVYFFSRNIFSDSIIWSTTNIPLLSLEAILLQVQYISERLNIEENKESFTHKFLSPKLLLEKKDKKTIIIQGSVKFNEKPREGIKYLQNNGILDKDATPESVASFLKNTNYVNKKLLGIYLSKQENTHILDCFVNTFDFHGKRIEEALRELLTFFRLPGESQQIERILEKFANKYYETNSIEIETADAAFVLAYSITMLNVDLHNTQVKKRMTIEEYTKNMRNLNNNKDFNPEYLKAIYEAIRTNEIIAPDEHNSQLGFEYTWRKLTKLSVNDEFRIYNTNIYDQYIFKAIWKPIIGSLSYAFISTTGDIFYRVINGLNQCTNIASQYKMSEVIDYMILCLVKIILIDDNELKNTSTTFLINVDGKDVYINPFSIKFGENTKTQLATIVLFKICIGNESIIVEGWKEIFKLLFILFVNHLLSPSFTQIQNYISIPPISINSKVKNSKKIDENKSTGLLSALSSYLSGYGTNDGFFMSEIEIEHAICAANCIKTSQIDVFYENIMLLDLDSVKPLLDFLLQPFSQDIFVILKLKNSSQDSLKSNYSINNDNNYLKYDEIILLRMEIATCFVLHNITYLKEFSKKVSQCLLNFINNSEKISHIMTERFIIYLLRIAKEDIDKAENQLDICSIFHSIASLTDSFIIKHGFSISNGILEIIKLPVDQSYINSSDLFKLISLVQENESVIPISFEIIQHLLSQKLLKENFHLIIFLLNRIINYTSVIKKNEHERIRSSPNELFTSNYFIDYAIRSITLLYQLHLKAPSFFSDSKLEFNEVWRMFWAPIFDIFQEQCTNIFFEIRQQAFTCLQKSFLSSHLSNNEDLQWTLIFKEVLFPLIFRLLKPEIYQLDLQGMAQARIQAVTLLCKVYLNYLVKLSKYDGMLDLWTSLLDVIDRLINSGQPDHLTEAILESLKNVLLVMNTSGYLVPPLDSDLILSKNSDDNQFRYILWKETWIRIDRFLPNLKEELFPASVHSN